MRLPAVFPTAQFRSAVHFRAIVRSGISCRQEAGEGQTQKFLMFGRQAAEEPPPGG
jgi:hypothetical protein